jgi:hypothetical protein
VHISTPGSGSLCYIYRVIERTPGQAPAAQHYLRRRIVVGLAAIVVVGSTGLLVGSLVADRHALDKLRMAWDQKRRAFDDYRRRSEANHRAREQQRRAEEQSRGQATQPSSSVMPTNAATP